MVVWANLPDEALDWYENKYIPEMTALHSSSTLHCQLTTTGLESESSGHLEAPWELMAVYEVEDARKMAEKTYDKRNHPTYEAADLLAKARFDVSIYREINRWEGPDGWDGDMTQVASVTATQIDVDEANHDEIINFYKDSIAPTIASSGDVLRLRLFVVDNVTVLADGSYITKVSDSVHSYFALLECCTDEWPWEKILELYNQDLWNKYWEPQLSVKWRSSHYLVERLYPDHDPGSAESQENSDANS